MLQHTSSEVIIIQFQINLTSKYNCTDWELTKLIDIVSHCQRFHSENRATSQIWEILPNMVFPPIWGKKWWRSEHAHASYPGLFFRPSGFSPYMGREERRVQGLD